MKSRVIELSGGWESAGGGKKEARRVIARPVAGEGVFVTVRWSTPETKSGSESR